MELSELEYAEGMVNELLKDNKNVTYSEKLHLGVSLRSYRTEKLSAMVHALLAIDSNAADIYAIPLFLPEIWKKLRDGCRKESEGQKEREY